MLNPRQEPQKMRKVMYSPNPIFTFKSPVDFIQAAHYLCLSVDPLVRVCLSGVCQSFPLSFVGLFVFLCHSIRLLSVILFITHLSVHEVCQTCSLIAVWPLDIIIMHHHDDDHHDHDHDHHEDRLVRKEKSVTTGESFC